MLRLIRPDEAYGGSSKYSSYVAAHVRKPMGSRWVFDYMGIRAARLDARDLVRAHVAACRIALYWMWVRRYGGTLRW